MGAMDPQAHVPREQLFALMHALQRTPPPAQGEGADPELAGILAGLGEPFKAALPPDQRLGAETVARHLAHSRECAACRCLLVEDGPAARPAKTAADVKSEAVLAEEQRKKKVVKFWTMAPIGLAAFFGSQVVRHIWWARHHVERTDQGARLDVDRTRQGIQVDPLFMLMVALILVAAWCIAESYVLARELWIDWTRLKAAVPVVGKRWAERGKAKLGD